MIYRALDANGDFTLGRKNEFLSGVEAVTQAIYTRLWLWQGEWWEDLQSGLPMMQRILGYRNTQQAADILIQARIAETTGVLDVISFSSSFDQSTRAYTCSAEVNTLYGAVQITEVSF
jgi:hypothetical protein